MNTRTKGQILEKYVCEQIKDKGIDTHPRPSFNSGATNTEKSDIWTSMMILGQNAGIECKNQNTLKIQEWWRQTKKLETLSKEPMLVFHIKNEPLQETKVVMYLDTILEMIKKLKDYEETK